MILLASLNERYPIRLFRSYIGRGESILYTECPGSSDPSEKIFSILLFASENEVYTIYKQLRYFRLSIIHLQSKVILGRLLLPEHTVKKLR